MKFCIRSQYLENAYSETIGAEQFNLIKRSRQVLMAALEIEQLFDNLISNYLEVERRCLGLTANRLARRSVGYRENSEDFASINLAFVNYLTTAKAYVDQIGSKTSRCFHGSEAHTAKETVKSSLAAQYDAAFEYRFMEALRNHVQHSGSALHMLQQGSLRTGDVASKSCESFLEPLCEKRNLAEDEKFKAAVLIETPDVINLLESTRSHVRGLSQAHHSIRDSISEAVSAAAAHIKAGQELLRGKITGSLDATKAISITHDGEVAEAVPMLLKWEEVRTWLAQRNSGLPDREDYYPSGRVVAIENAPWNGHGD